MLTLGLCLWDMGMVTDILILDMVIRITTLVGIFRFMVTDMVMVILTMDMDTATIIMVLDLDTTTTTITPTTLDEEALPIPIE